MDFTVCSYIEDESSKKYCGPVKTFSVVDMIESYYVMDDYKSQVKDCFNGLNNASKITLPSFNAGTTFNSSTLPVPTDATYTITYDCEDAGIFNATAPTANGKGWTMTITINKDDADNIFSVTSNWFLFIEKAEAVVTFSKSFENGARFTSDQLPTVTVSEGATYTVTYDCGDADITGATAPTANGYGWKIVVTVNEDDTYAAKSVKSKWFRFVKDAEVTIQSFESGATFNASTLPTVTVSDGADFDITYDCGDAGIKGAISPVANGKGWKVVVTVKQDGIFNGSVTKSTGWFRYLEIPTITFSNTEAGLTLGEVPTYTVSPTEAEMQEYKNSAFTGYSITVTYDCEGAGLSNESKPLDNGQGWVMKVKISRSNYNEKVTVISKWFYYKPEGNAN